MIRFLPLLAFLGANAATAEPLVIDHGRLFVPVTINGMATEGLLDSGAEMTVIDPSFAAKAGIKAGAAVDAKGTGEGTAQANFAHGVSVAALGRNLGKRDVVILDLSEVSARLIQRPTVVILGRDMFDAGRLRVDLENRDVRLLAKDEEPAGVPLRLTAHKGIETIPVVAGAMSVLADLDFGNGSPPIVSRGLADALGLKAIGTTSAGGIGGAGERQLVVLPTLSVAGVTFRDFTATVDEKDKGLMMNIGTSILQHFVVTTDFPGRTAYFQPIGGQQ